MNQTNTYSVLNMEALFADSTGRYVKYLPEADGLSVLLRFRTARDNAQAVDLVTDQVVLPMRRTGSDELFDWYEISVRYPEVGSSYYFRVFRGTETAVFDKRGAGREHSSLYDLRFEPQLSVPSWAQGAVIYQIFPDRFFNGDRSNDVTDGEYSYLHQRAWHENDWFYYPPENDFCHFYGGDLQGILEKLDYLQELGVEVLYLNPIFVSPSSHGYDTQDYDHIDPHFGKIVKDGGEALIWEDEDNSHASRYITRVTSRENLEESDAFFAAFTEEVHRRGMRVILDGVFNHCGSFHKWLDREGIYAGQEGYAPGAFRSKESPYREHFRFLGEDEAGNEEYEGWWDHLTLPKLNYEGSEQLQEYIIGIGRKWVSPPYNADGWRLDVAADLGHSLTFNHAFWKRFREAVRSANPEAVVLAEHYDDPMPWLAGGEWDTVMNYQAFMEPVTWFLTGMEKHSDSRRDDLYCNFEAFRDAVTKAMSRMPGTALSCAMNELSNHDHSRFLTRTNRHVGRRGDAGPEAASEGIQPCVMREAVLIQMTWPGAPTVYYGDEAGLCGWTDPDNRRTYPWGREDQQMIAFHREMIRLHKEIPALRRGSLKLLCGEYGILSYARFDEESHCIIAVNNLEETSLVRIPAALAGIAPGTLLRMRMLTDAEGFAAEVSERGSILVTGEYIEVLMPPFSGILLADR